MQNPLHICFNGMLPAYSIKEAIFLQVLRRSAFHLLTADKPDLFKHWALTIIFSLSASREQHEQGIVHAQTL